MSKLKFSVVADDDYTGTHVLHATEHQALIDFWTDAAEEDTNG